ncbi:F-box only protein 8-like [Lycium barbarum]|uniref:F-box only protein 8-like n=1 Tax=Lycium barbarum TaxID=112863 RepID=UPI00293E22E9|nr:F-box only protein 8-like [Lycium barbarum]
MEGSLDELAITTTKKRRPSPFQDKGATKSIQKRCRRTEEKHGFADDIVFEILTWLPAKSLMRFRCVSKAWNRLTQHDSNFVKSHSARSQARPSATRLLFEIRICRGALVESTSNSPTRLEGLSLQLVRPHPCLNIRYCFIRSNHCNGLVCLFNLKDKQVYLHNVTTREIKVLPFSVSSPIELFPWLFLGFDLNTEKYKLLHIVRYGNKQQKIEILTLGTNSWRRIDNKCAENSYSTCSYEDCIFLNGVIYWIEFGYTTITYFNFREEEFGTISIPQSCCCYSIKMDKMQTALRGKLVVICRLLVMNETCDFVYNEVNKVFMKFNNPDLEKKKVVLLEEENINEITYCQNLILATTSFISASTSLVVFSNRFRLERDTNKSITIDQMIDEVKALYGAGHLTTTSLLGWSVFLLALHPEWQEKARKEVFAFCGLKNPTSDANRKTKNSKQRSQY